MTHSSSCEGIEHATFRSARGQEYCSAAPKTGHQMHGEAINHERCWAQGRRACFDALTAEPTGAADALKQIKAMYAAEDRSAAASSSAMTSCIS